MVEGLTPDKFKQAVMVKLQHETGWKADPYLVMQVVVTEAKEWKKIEMYIQSSASSPKSPRNHSNKSAGRDGKPTCHRCGRSAISKKIARRLQEGSLGSQVPRTTPIVGIKGKDEAIRVVVAVVLPAGEDRSRARSSSSRSRSKGPALRPPQQLAMLLRSGRCK